MDLSWGKVRTFHFLGANLGKGLICLANYPLHRRFGGGFPMLPKDFTIRSGGWQLVHHIACHGHKVH